MEIRHNVSVCYNSVIALNEETDLIASTLWAHISPSEEYLTERCVSDFKRIRNGEFRLSAQRFNEEHEVCRNFIEKAVSESNAERIVVATHHVPSFALMAEEFKDSSINGAFTVELAGMIAESRINCWIYGHSHHSIDMTIGNTRLVSNPLGYVFCGENSNFNDSAVIEV